MRAIRVAQFGEPEVLKLEEVPLPTPAAGQVLVHVRAVGVNPYETYMRAGTYPIKPQLPYTPGSDAAGVVESVGPGVTKVKAGDRVYTVQIPFGAYAEYALAQENQVEPLPEEITFAQARESGFPTAPPTTRCFIPRKPAPANPCSSMEPAAAWGPPRYKWPAPWASRFSAPRAATQASNSSSAKAPTTFSITLKRLRR